MKKKTSKPGIEGLGLPELYEFMEYGSLDKAPAEIKDYVLLIDKVRAMHMRIDQFGSPEPIIKHLMAFDGLSRYKANQIYQEALEYFYCDNIISKRAWKNIYGNKLDQLINFSMQIMKDVGDAQKIARMIADAAKVRGLEEPETEEIPDDFYKAPVKVYTTDAAALGLPKADRNRLKELIDKVPDLTEKEKQRIYQEAEIVPFKIFANEQEDPRKS